MPLLGVETCVLHRRALVNCKPRSPSSLLWEVNASYGSRSPSTKTSTISAVSSYLLPPKGSLSFQNKDANPQVSLPEVAQSSKLRLLTPSSVEQLMPSLPTLLPQATNIADGFAHSRDLPRCNSCCGASLSKDLGLNVRGHMIGPRVRWDEARHWRQSINTIRCCNDPLLIPPKQYAGNDAFLSSSPENSSERRCGYFHGSGTSIQPVYSKTPKSNDGGISRHALAPRDGKKFGLGGNLLQPQLSEENDKEFIRAIRQMLRQTKVRVNNSPDKEQCSELDLQSAELSNSSLKAEGDGFLEKPTGFHTQPPNADDGLESDSTSKHSDEVVSVDDTDYKDSPVDRRSVNCDTTRLNKTYRKDDTNTIASSGTISPLPKSKENQNEETISRYAQLQNKRVSFAAVTSMQKYNHQGLQLIDKIKNTQQWLASVRVKSPLLSSSQGSITEENEACSEDNHPPDCDTLYGHRQRLARCSNHQLTTTRQPFTKAAVSNCWSKPASNLRDELGGGDSAYKPTKSVTQSHLRLELITSPGSTMKSDIQERTLCWLRSVEPLVVRNRETRNQSTAANSELVANR